jgi:hypothetical protein
MSALQNAIAKITELSWNSPDDFEPYQALGREAAAELTAMRSELAEARRLEVEADELVRLAYEVMIIDGHFDWCEKAKKWQETWRRHPAL